MAEKEKAKEKVKAKVKAIDKPKEKVKSKNIKKKKSNIIANWWRETMGELRRVTWPTPQEAWRLTRIVIVVIVIMSFLLGLFDFIFSKLIAILYA